MREQVIGPADALDPAWEQQPSPDKYKTHRPLDGIPYKVQTGDNFESLALLSGMSPKALLEYNFLTTKPQTINYYLRTYVGCRTRSWDNKSFSFRTEDSPGIIEFPPQAYKRLAEVMNPAPVWEDQAWRVRGIVPHYHQFDSWRCWSACFAAMLSYRKGTSLTIPAAMAMLGTKWVDRYNQTNEDEGGILSRELRELGQAAGLIAIPGSVSKLPNDWINDLERWGPMLVTQAAGGFDTHMVVVLGYRLRRPSIFELFVMDPNNGATIYVDGMDLINKANLANSSWEKRFRLP
jgi:hypothetical protein